jgi:hypothetical protein
MDTFIWGKLMWDQLFDIVGRAMSSDDTCQWDEKTQSLEDYHLKRSQSICESLGVLLFQLNFMMPCRWCRETFQIFYDKKTLKMNASEMFTYLWRLHQIVNQKLAMQKTIDAMNTDGLLSADIVDHLKRIVVIEKRPLDEITEPPLLNSLSQEDLTPEISERIRKIWQQLHTVTLPVLEANCPEEKVRRRLRVHSEQISEQGTWDLLFVLALNMPEKDDKFSVETDDVVHCFETQCLGTAQSCPVGKEELTTVVRQQSLRHFLEKLIAVARWCGDRRGFFWAFQDQPYSQWLAKEAPPETRPLSETLLPAELFTERKTLLKWLYEKYSLWQTLVRNERRTTFDQLVEKYNMCKVKK